MSNLIIFTEYCNFCLSKCIIYRSHVSTDLYVSRENVKELLEVIVVYFDFVGPKESSKCKNSFVVKNKEAVLQQT